jgi:hypothetical protein
MPDDAADAEGDVRTSADAVLPEPQPGAAPGAQLAAAQPGTAQAVAPGQSDSEWDDDAGSETAPAPPVETRTGRSAMPSSDPEEASLNIPHSGMPLPLRGSLESLERQNTRLDAEGLERIQDEADLAERIAHKLLVPVPVSSALTVNADLPENHRYCRPWTARFLADLAREHEAAFHRPLEVSSAVRTVEYQQHLMRSNGNAAPAEGDIVSPHLTGATIDIAKKGLTRDEIAWMRTRLAAIEAEGKIDVEEEFRQACFHITVYKDYAPARPIVPAQPAKPGANPSPPPSDADAAQGL